jgi:hypothetical protein
MIAYIRYRANLARAYGQFLLERKYVNRVERLEWRRALITLVYHDSKLKG